MATIVFMPAHVTIVTFMYARESTMTIQLWYGLCGCKTLQVRPLGTSRLRSYVYVTESPVQLLSNSARLLVYHLMHSNSQIQKIVAFENAFEWLMNIVTRRVIVMGVS